MLHNGCVVCDMRNDWQKRRKIVLFDKKSTAMIEYQPIDQHRPRTYLDAVLRRDRSLSAESFHSLMRWVLMVSLTIGCVFYWKGAWPVVGFMGLDVLLIWLGFQAYFRQQEQQFERIILDEYGLRIERHHHGRCHEVELEPSFMQVHLERDLTHQPLRLCARGRMQEVGRWLGLAEKECLSETIKDALYRQRTRAT
jgi:uncharacterized membrane protein